jgi:hypothetical protein
MDEESFLKIYYMNDEQKPITVQVNHAFFFDPNDLTKQPKIEYFTLQPAEARVFSIEVFDTKAIPFVKKWQNQVLLTYHNQKG